MPWYKETIMSQRREFIGLIESSVKVSDACRRFGISRRTGYKWLGRFEAEGEEALEDRSRRPLRSPNKTPDEAEQVILRARKAHPAWGGRKLKRWLQNRGVEGLPSPSTITEILRRHGRIDRRRAGSGNLIIGSRPRNRTICGRWTSRVLLR